MDQPTLQPTRGSGLQAEPVQARQRQIERQGCANAFLDLPGLRQHCRLDSEDACWLETACERLGLSLRAAHRVMKVARTLADLEGIAGIGQDVRRLWKGQRHD